MEKDDIIRWEIGSIVEYPHYNGIKIHYQYHIVINIFDYLYKYSYKESFDFYESERLKDKEYLTSLIEKRLYRFIKKKREEIDQKSILDNFKNLSGEITLD